MKLEVGKYYKTRDGRKVGPMWGSEFGHDKTFGVLYANTPCGSNAAFYIDGGKRQYDGLFEDIISEWTDTPEIGTLAEIGAQVGDVVACYNEVYNGQEITVTKESKNWIAYDMPWWRIITRAKPQGPVIEETTVTKRIVPGVYGKVEIMCSAGNGVDLRFPENDLVWDRADLIAARDVFNQLIDAMEDE